MACRPFARLEIRGEHLIRWNLDLGLMLLPEGVQSGLRLAGERSTSAASLMADTAASEVVV